MHCAGGSAGRGQGCAVGGPQAANVRVGNNGSYFIPLNIAVAKQHGKAFYILPGRLPPQPADTVCMPGSASRYSDC